MTHILCLVENEEDILFTCQRKKGFLEKAGIVDHSVSMKDRMRKVISLSKPLISRLLCFHLCVNNLSGMPSK